MISLTRAARLAALTTIETLARGLFPDVPAISFVDRALIIAACIKVGQLYPTRNESDEQFAAYEQALAELASHTSVTRVLALATFRGVRDPAEISPVEDWAHRLTESGRALLRYFPTYGRLEDAHKRQASYIRSAHLAVMNRARDVSLLGDLGGAIDAIADQRDEAQRALEELAGASREIADERDQLKAQLFAATSQAPEEDSRDDDEPDADESDSEGTISETH